MRVLLHYESAYPEMCTIPAPLGAGKSCIRTHYGKCNDVFDEFANGIVAG